MKVNTTAINTHDQQVQIPEDINSEICGSEEISLNIIKAFPEQEHPRQTIKKKPVKRNEDFLMELWKKSTAKAEQNSHVLFYIYIYIYICVIRI